MTVGYCPHCMNPASGGRCPRCGGELNWTGKKGIDLPVGTVLTGGDGLRAYQIGAARGMGGFGITYIALELNSHKRTAVKEYFPTRCALRGGDGISVQTMTGQESLFQGGMKSFLKEAGMLLAQDDLPSVVRVMDYFEANGTAYLVMEYLDGVPLHAQMARMGGRIPADELMPRLAPLLRDIGRLHRRGIIHRDISPDNIMWMPDGGLKLLDFGSARSMENGKTMTVLMKQGFSPIEQYRSRGQGPYTDIYALAATICYCVTGTIPPSAVERLDNDPLQSPIALGAALTVDQETALLWALSVQPSARPQSMEEFAGMLFKEAPKPRPAPEPEPAPAQPEPPQAAPAAAAQTWGAPPDYQPMESGFNSPPPGGKEETVLPGKLGYWLQRKGISGRTAMAGITAAVVIMAVIMAIYAVRHGPTAHEMREWAPRAIRTGFILYTLGDAGFAVCAVLLIVMRKKMGPYIGAIISLAAALFSYIRYTAAFADYFGYAAASTELSVIIRYIVVGLSAAAVTLYWWAQRGQQGV